MRRRGRYELLSDARLQALVDGDGVVPLLIGGPDTRLSLAGANPRYQHLPVNEAFVMGLAARVGLATVDVELLARVIALVRDHVRAPLVDVQRLLAWQAFNVIAGSDGHGKNLSLLYDDDGLALAPFYDLLSTRLYAASGCGAPSARPPRATPQHLRRRHRNWPQGRQDLREIPP